MPNRAAFSVSSHIDRTKFSRTIMKQKRQLSDITGFLPENQSDSWEFIVIIK